jgi:hypothetical protein
MRVSKKPIGNRKRYVREAVEEFQKAAFLIL